MWNLCATTVGEELTKHGAAWCASRIAPTLAVVLDVTYTSDYEGTRAIENGEIILGGGPVFLHNSFSHKMVGGATRKSCPEYTYKISVGERMWKNLYGRRCYSYGRQGDTYNSYVHTSSLYA